MDFETISEYLISRGVVETTRSANTTAMYAIQWFHGHIFDLKKQVQTHRARLRKIGIDIAQNDVYRVSVKGTKYPYSTDIRDTKGHAVLVSDNPVMIALYKSINGFSHSNVTYHEASDDNNLHIRMPRIFYEKPNSYFGGYSSNVTVVLSIATTTVTLENSWDLCKGEKVPAPGSTADNPKTQRKSICHPDKAVYKTTNDVQDVKDQIFLMRNLTYQIYLSKVIDNIRFQAGGTVKPGRTG